MFGPPPPLVFSGLPDMSLAIQGFSDPYPIVWQVKGQSINADGLVVPTTTNVNTYGVLIDIRPEEATIKETGWQSWKWWSLHTLVDCTAKIGDYFIIDGIKYVVKYCQLQRRAGFNRYELIQYFG